MNQLNLFDQQAKLRKAAADWIIANPQAFALFERFALNMAASGRRFGMKALAERVRWEVLATWEKDADGYRLNNNLPAYLGRELVARHPELANFLEFRRCRDERQGEPSFAVVQAAEMEVAA